MLVADNSVRVFINMHRLKPNEHYIAPIHILRPLKKELHPEPALEHEADRERREEPRVSLRQRL